MTTQYAIQIRAKDRIEINKAMAVPEVGPSQILLEIEACGICFSDTKLMHAFESHPRKTPLQAGLTPTELAEIPTYRPGSDPVVPGHEPVARVAKVGQKITRFQVGQRVVVQTDYRHLPTKASNASFGYDFDGGLEEYALVDERMVIDPESGESYLIPVGETPSAAAVALIEPWACVEMAYCLPERRGIKPDGSLLVVIDPGLRPGAGLFEFIDAAPSGAKMVCSSISAVPEPETYDDIIYVGADAGDVEILGSHLGRHGIMNIVTCGQSFTRKVNIDAGRVHYDGIRYVGTTGDRPEDGYCWVPDRGELRAYDKVAVIGAAGPMGLIHAVRTLTSGTPGVTLDAVDVDEKRLTRLREVLTPIAAEHGVPTRVFNSNDTPLTPGYTYVALMVVSPCLLSEIVDLAGDGAIVNTFAGFAVGTTAAMDMNTIVSRRIYLVGTSGSRITDMETVLRRLEDGTVDTTISLDAVTGMAGVPDAIKSVNDRTSQGKIMVYPKLHELGLTRLVDLETKLPLVAAAMEGGRWTLRAEKVLLASERRSNG